MAGWVCPHVKNVEIPALSSSKERLHTDTTVVKQAMTSFWDRAVF